MRNKKNKSAADDVNDDKSGRGYPRRWGLLLINPLVDSNILGGEQNLWDIGNRRYLAMKKVTLSGSLQAQTRLEGGEGAKRQRILN